MTSPTRLIVVDFETYYDAEYSLSKMTTEAYVRDPRFEVIGVGVRDGKTRLWLERSEFMEWLRCERFVKTAALLAHHAHFDGLILSHHFGIRPAFWFDTLSMARALHGTEVGNSLGTLMPKYGLGEKGHEVIEAKGKHRRDFTPAEYAAYGEYCLNDCDGAFGLAKAMVPQFDETELRLIDTTVRMFSEPSLRVDSEKLSKYLAWERARKAALLEQCGADKSTLMSNDKLAALFQTLQVEPPTKVSPATGKEIFAFAKSDPGMQELLEDPRDEVRWVAEARIAVKSTINETRTERLLGAGARGELPIYLKFSGAHTHRWAGGDSMNPQNWERTNDDNPRKGVIRQSLLAPEGKVVVACDSGAIEARMTAWMAGHDRLVQAFADGADIYSEFATHIYKRKVDRKKNKEDKLPGFVGKVCILGLGYGMGWKKFAGTMLAGAMGGPPVVFTREDAANMSVNVRFFEGDYEGDVRALVSRLGYDDLLVHCAVAKHIVDEYRRSNAPITRLWRKMDAMLKTMAIDSNYKRDMFFPYLEVERHRIRLPGGLYLRYPGLEAKEDGCSYLSGHAKKRVRAYGGSMTENVVQALARRVVAEQMLRIQDELGLHIVTMTHDEVVVIVDEGLAESTLSAMVQIMKTAPAWAKGLPLAAEGGFGRSYGEAK